MVDYGGGRITIRIGRCKKKRDVTNTINNLKAPPYNQDRCSEMTIRQSGREEASRGKSVCFYTLRAAVDSSVGAILYHEPLVLPSNSPSDR
jgi:hypothetical protein